MSQATLPEKPVENWEQVRDEWVAAVQQLTQDVKSWSQRQQWAVRREPKTVVEDRLGSYVVPRLLIHAPHGRLLLDPVTRYVVGAEGLIDLYVLPSYDSVRIARTPDGWKLHLSAANGPILPWSEDAFLDTARRLFEAA